MTEQERSAIQDAITALDDAGTMYALAQKGIAQVVIDNRIDGHGGFVAYMTEAREKLERILKA